MMRRLYSGLVARKTRMLFLNSQGNSFGDCKHSVTGQSMYSTVNVSEGKSLFVRTHSTLPDNDEVSVAKFAKEIGPPRVGAAKLLKLFADLNGKRAGVQIADSEDVDALREAIKNKFAVALANYDSSDLIVKLSADAKALNPEDLLSEVLLDANRNPIKYVYVELPLNQPIASGPSRWWQLFEGKRDTLDWQFDSGATAFTNELLCATPERINIPGEDDEGKPIVDRVLEVTALQSSLQQDEKVTFSTMVMPQSTREMWQFVLKNTQESKYGQRVIVVGSPGLGKSRSINYFIKLLITTRSSQANKRPMPVVVFEHRKDGLVYLFAPVDPANKDSKYEAYSLDRTKFSAKTCVAVNNPNNYYIVDTSQAERAKMPSLVAAVTVYVCSPDPRHYSEFEKHTQRGFKIFCPAWKPQDILAARKFMTNPPLEESQVRERLSVVGPIPRRVFAQENAYQAFKTRIDEALRDHQDDIERVLMEGSSALETITQHDQKPRSSIFMFGVYENNFLQPTIHFVSDYARSRVSLNVLKKVLANITFRDPARSVEYGTLWERVCFAALDSGWRGDLEPIPIVGTVPVDTCEEFKASQMSKTAKQGSGVTLVDSGTGLWKRVYAQMRNMPILPETCVPVYFGANFPLFDASDARNRGFNVTLARKKDLPIATIRKIRNELKLSSSQFLHIVYLVPQGSALKLELKNQEQELATLVKIFKMELPSLDSESWKLIATRISP